MKDSRITAFIAALLLTLGVNAHVTLPDIFSDHMVLQQESMITVWGWAKPGEVVQITCSWDQDTTYSIKVDSRSAWSIDIKTPSAGGPYQLRIRGYNTIEINDILIGEVWLGSGQSNMEWSAAMGIDNAPGEIAGANHPEIRFFTVHTTTAETPQQLAQGEWVSCTPETMKQFSALMYFFGRELHGALKVPVGLINSSWGGTPIEIWMPESSIRGDRLLDRYAGLLKPVPWGPVDPGAAFNSMIHPLVPFRIKGALWYQGESNVDHPEQYARALKTMVESWRASWGYDFPFYYAQIAPWSGYGEDNVNGAILRDQQRKALHHDYGCSERPFSGPLFRSHQIKKGSIVLEFDYADGLTAKEGTLRDFELLSQSREWIEAKAHIAGHHVEVDVPDGGAKGIRYAYRNDADPNLFNSAGLPASCFAIMFNPNPEKQ
jgi:sialate O-acetylesterase